MSDSWDTPDTPDFFTIKEHVGDLVIIAPAKFTPSFPTANGERDAIHAEIGIVEGNLEGTRWNEALLFGSKLVPQLRNKIGSVVLGRIQLGEKQAGKNAPYILAKATDADKALASKWVKANGDIGPAQHVTGKTLTSVAAGVDDEDIPF
jgi:hypothetical protein